MRVLIDTHVFLWAVLEDRRLSDKSREIWLAEDSILLISPASLWEIAIKVGQGKLEVGRPLDEFFGHELAANDLELLPARPLHFAKVAQLPLYHRDPFDRLLVAQGVCENLPILSIDAMLDAYGVTRIW